MSSISIIGTGNMASALAGRALAGGNAVEIVGRDPVKAKELAAALGGATVGMTDTAPAGDIVILAVPYASAAAVIGQYGDALHGKVVVDITNPITPDFRGFLTPEGTSGAQEIAKAAPTAASGPRRPLRQAHQLRPRRQRSQLTAPHHVSRHDITPADRRHTKNTPFHLS
jgi:predicted dinucleotide-binding enzyme